MNVTRCSTVLWGLVLATTGLRAGQILGFPSFGPITSLDAASDITTSGATGSILVFGASQSPLPGQSYLTTGVNLYTMDLSGHSTFQAGLLLGALDLAFDRGAGIIYGIGGLGLYKLDLGTNCTVSPGIPDLQCTGTPFSALPAGIQGIDFVPGAGLFGVSNSDHILYRVDPLTGQVTPIGPTGIAATDGVMDLAYDSETGYFVASVIPGVLDKPNFASPGSGMIYRINPTNGSANLLNGNAPVMLGLAENVPEPSSGALVLSALAGLLMAWWPGRKGTNLALLR